jgi:hypothetical protein
MTALRCQAYARGQRLMILEDGIQPVALKQNCFETTAAVLKGSLWSLMLHP